MNVLENETIEVMEETLKEIVISGEDISITISMCGGRCMDCSGQCTNDCSGDCDGSSNWRD